MRMLGSASGQLVRVIAVQAELAARSTPISIMSVPAGPELKLRTSGNATGSAVSSVRQRWNPAVQ